MTLRLRRRATLALGAAALARPAIAQAPYPARPIRMYVPWAPGGTTDVQMRALCDAASRRAGQPVVVENKSGAGGILGAQAMLNDKPDGYSLGQMPVSVFRTPLMSSRPMYDPVNDFTYIVHLCGYLFGVVVRADAPWKTFPEFLDYAKANPGKVNYGTPGIGTSLHLTMERIASDREIDWTHVPFRGFAENMNALLGGQIDALADSSGWAQLVEDGRARLLVTWGEARAKRFPDAPTLREVGIDIVSASPYGIGGPKGMDPGLVRAIHDIFRDALQDPAHLAILERFDMPVMLKGPEEYQAFVRRQVEEDRAMIRKLGLKLN
ncbi:tripartite tricarboxylate transporter substrate binding protein [Paracraurococcus lichenis]|uniref:Tripartite tricarboxylate transporter substrate binding protein n=1 Tax=Paracraurococcus lichenis TaxID=3064888 RepID=A0ABT9E2T6_9PROT|nr:tripartite tricarboxylate transporter substrate binding protein [Paracraurococcus sp. LOR1-02]MDO9710461.1 tripartite tricarboxylate transporter substrate binding protein [Paracraurococcus sp. LOR1-02]